MVIGHFQFSDKECIEFARNAAIIVTAIVLSKILQLVLLKFFVRFNGWFHWQLNENLELFVRRPLLMVLIFSLVHIALHFTTLHDDLVSNVQLVLRVLITISTGWLFIGVIRGLARWLNQHISLQKTRDPLAVRRFGTQIHLMMRVAISIVVVLTGIGVALVIPGLRQFGVSLFASAGVASLVIGMAANSTLSNLFAGLQIAITQPILLGDEVVVNTFSGTIEEIRASYVVIKLVDARRMIVPLNYFMQNPFVNATYEKSK